MSFVAPSLHARNEVNLNYGKSVKVISDKQFRITKDDIFEAIGNVIISQGQDTIYGERATLSATTGDVEASGNVRYTGPQITLYGSELKYNLKNQKMSLSKARILSENFVVLGKEIKREVKGTYEAVGAEYTTCRDCPESWSIYGENIHITVGEYVRIWHAYIKVKGVVIMYVPYIILPIKNSRETGLLFPDFGLNIEEGTQFTQPFFWAISQNKDMTLSPRYLGERGLGSELQFRHAIKDGLWYEFDGLYSDDRIYEPGKVERERGPGRKFRHLSQWEHSYNNGRSLNHYLRYNFAQDMDLMRDYSLFTDDKILSSDIGLESFFEFNGNLLSATVEAGHRRNMLFDDTYGFDDKYVQILPRATLTSAPIFLFNNPDFFLSRLSFSFHGDHTVFKQNNFSEGNFIRNAHRVNLQPVIRADFLNMGPVRAYTQARYDFQYYHLPNEEKQSWFSKRAVVHETAFEVELEKVFGIAYNDRVEVDDKVDNLKNRNKSNLIGTLPSLENKDEANFIIKSRKSFKHGQKFILKHYFLSNADENGSERFLNQISNNGGVNDDGVFDPIDFIRANENQSNIESSRTTLPVSNTVELRWENNLVEKTVRDVNVYDDNRGLLDNFNYRKVAYFNVSQGFDFDRDDAEFENNLTRLHVDTGFTVNNLSISSNFFYYYENDQTIFNINLSQNFSFVTLNSSLRFNSFRIPTDKFFQIGGRVNLSDLISLQGNWEYDIEQKLTNRSRYGIVYSPSNNCWRLLIDYEKTIYNKALSFNFLLNFNNTFQGGNQ